MEARKLVKRSAVRRAFHERNTRLPRGFFDEVKQTIMSVLRKIGQGEIEPDGNVMGERVYIRRVALKKTLRAILGKKRVDESLVAHVNNAVADKVEMAVERRVTATPDALKTFGVPSGVLRKFLRAKQVDPKLMHGSLKSIEKFFRRWQNPTFRAEWSVS